MVEPMRGRWMRLFDRPELTTYARLSEDGTAVELRQGPAVVRIPSEALAEYLAGSGAFWRELGRHVEEIHDPAREAARDLVALSEKQRAVAREGKEVPECPA